MSLPILEKWLYIPEDRITPLAIRTNLVVQPHRRGADPEEQPAPIHVYDMGSKPGFIGLPIEWGLEHYGSEGYVDETSNGQTLVAPSRADPNHPNAAPGQEEFARDMLEACRDFHTVLAVAPTGSGKTVVSLNTIADLGRSALVIVPTVQIMKQWIKAAKTFLGLTDNEIGIVQQNKCEFHKPLCIATVQSVTKRDYDPAFYDAFGSVWWDECHRMAAQVFSQSLGLFNAKLRVGLSATWKRKDEAHKVIELAFGKPIVKGKHEAMECIVVVVDHREPLPEWATDFTSRVKAVTSLKRRNKKVLEIIMACYRKGRQMLVVAEHIPPLEKLAQALRKQGVPDIDIGQFTGQFTNDEGGRSAVSDEYLDWVREVPPLVLATYNMMKEGTDIPRLDCGLDYTPRSDATQLLGRIRRPLPGKPKPVWYTINDVSDFAMIGYFKGRMRDYEKDRNIEVVYHATR